MPIQTSLRDNYTLRISVTSHCNLNCVYCNPVISKFEMSDDDLIKIIKAAALAGVKKISWTGGEPTVKKGLAEIIKTARELGIQKQSMTTNGVLFYKKAQELKNAGLTRVNISLDTLDAAEYKSITKRDALPYVLKSIETGINIFGKLKIHHVVTRKNIHTIPQFIDFAQQYGDRLTIRFLELVPCNNASENDKKAFNAEFVSKDEIKETLKSFGKLSNYENTGDVPKSIYYKIEGKKGIFGINPNHSVSYRCDREKCPKIRVSPTGFVSNCTTNLKFCRNFKGIYQKQANELMEKIVHEKETRNYKGFLHKQKYYDFWRFGVPPMNELKVD